MKPFALPVLISLFLAALSPAATLAEDQPSNEPTALKERNWSATVPLWVPGYRGDFAIGEFDVEGESSGGTGVFDRLFGNKMKLNFFFMGAFNYEKERWRVHLDVFRGNFTDDVIFNLTDGTVVSADIKPTMPHLHVAYRVWQHSWNEATGRRMRLSVYSGLRYQDVNIALTVLGQTVTSGARWTDPILGLWVPVDLSRRWSLELSGDIGWLKIGSKNTWRLNTLAFYRASDLVSIILGYQIMDVDYHTDVASNRFLYKARLGGPMAGVKFSF